MFAESLVCTDLGLQNQGLGSCPELGVFERTGGSGDLVQRDLSADSRATSLFSREPRAALERMAMARHPGWVFCRIAGFAEFAGARPTTMPQLALSARVVSTDSHRKCPDRVLKTASQSTKNCNIFCLSALLSRKIRANSTFNHTSSVHARRARRAAAVEVLMVGRLSTPFTFRQI